MDVRRQRLPNGLRVAVVPIPGLLSAAVLLAIEAGQWFEPLGRPGVARLSALAMLRGTTSRDAKAWADALDGIGAAARLDVGSHAATFSAQSLGSDLDVLLELMADAVMRPAFAPTEVELVREQTVAQIEEDAKNTRAVERFTRIDENTIENQFTITDPTVYTRPWTALRLMPRLPGYAIYEYACHEGNYAMPGILGGARAEEKAAAEKAKKSGSR